MDKNYDHYKMLNVAQINTHENQKSGHEYISGMVLLVKIKTASRTHEDRCHSNIMNPQKSNISSQSVIPDLQNLLGS